MCFSLSESLFGPLQLQCEKVRVQVRVRLFVVIVGLRLTCFTSSSEELQLFRFN